MCRESPVREQDVGSAAMGGHRPRRHEPEPEQTLDANRYATKKTIAQGMLDIALLTANASQLKYILQVGKEHEFYTLMVTLISVSIILQVLMGVLFLTLNLLRDCRLHQEEYRSSALAINYATMAMSVAVGALNLLTSAFDPTLGAMLEAAQAGPEPDVAAAAA